MDDAKIEECREWLARQKAQLDQRKKQFEDQYPVATPHTNLCRMDDLEAQAFWISIHEWELEETIKYNEGET